MNRGLLLCLALAIWGMQEWNCQAAVKKKPALTPDQKDEGFQKLFQAVFVRWDRNHDGKLERKEINAVIEDPQIRGNESAVAAILRKRLEPDEEDEEKFLTLPQMLELSADPKVQQTVNRSAWHLQAINHSLFAPDDPKLNTFHQGGMGDCYLLSVIGAYVYHHADTVRTMIRSEPPAGFHVQFGDGRLLTVKPITDAELLMGAKEGNDHGIWLSVFEKAYAQIKEEARAAKGQAVEADEVIFRDLIGHGGACGPVMVLLTGHKTAGASFARWRKEDPEAVVQKAHDLLVRLSGEHRLMAAGTTTDKERHLPKGIAHGHAFAILEYNATNRAVHMFNPWGNHVKPAGAPGLVNGYLTEHGMFWVPIADFVQIFGGFTYETPNRTAQNRF